MHTLRALIVAGLCLSFARAVDLDSLQQIAPVASANKTDRGVLITCQDQSRVAIEFLAPDLVRIRAGFRSEIPDSHSRAVSKEEWEPVNWTLDETPDRITLKTSALGVVVHRSPLIIDFVNPVTGAVLNSDYQPMAFDPTSSTLAVRKKLGMEEHFYGLGEKASPLDRRRGRFTMWNTDAYGYKEGTDPLYQSIPFYIGLQNGIAYGVFYDNSHRSSFDFGSQSEEFTVYTADGGPLRYYFFAGPSMKSIVERYTQLTGRMPMPPRWALGHQQSRYSYYPDTEVLKIAQTYRQYDLPLDVIHLDINYMNGYRDFTWDPKKFPDPKGMTSQLANEGIKVVTIIDPGVKYDPPHDSFHYSVFDEGVAKDYFLKRGDGKLYVGKVWPGDAVFVDYTKPDAAKWWGQLFRTYLDAGVSGIWMDMNEPSDFVDQTGKTQMDVRYDDNGLWTNHGKNRNLFALEEANATYNGLKSLRPDQRPYLITRAGFAGIQRYTTMWTGDNTASWDSLALSLPMFESLGLSGESFVGSDVGGFIGRSNAELLTRWYEAALFSPMYRNHAEMGGYDHEPWRFGPYYETIIRKYLKLRYRLLPYLYTAVEESHRTGMPVYRPLVLEYQSDPNVLTIEDEFLAGPSLLVAPILKPDQSSRRVYLPAGTWYDFWTNRPLQGGRMIQVDAALDKLPIFVKAGAILPLGPEMNYSSEKPLDPLSLIAYPDARGSAAGSLYEDDGTSFDYENGAFLRSEFTLSGTTARVKTSGTYAPPKRRVTLTKTGTSVPIAITPN